METCHRPEKRRANKRALAALPCLGAPCRGLCLMPLHAALKLFQHGIRKMLHPHERARPQPGRHAPGGLWRKTSGMIPTRPAAGTLSPMRNSRAFGRHLAVRAVAPVFGSPPRPLCPQGAGPFLPVPGALCRHRAAMNPVALFFARRCFALPLHACIPRHVAALERFAGAFSL